MIKLPAGAFLLSFMLTTSALATAPVTLNSISYQVTEQRWVKSKQVTATIGINATVSGQNVAILRQSMMHNLQKVAQGDWHIIQFNRDKTRSGLESVQALAQIRLPADALNQIYQRVKSVSKVGQTYSVSSLNFNPDMADIAVAQTMLRQKIYADVQTELKNLNKQFSNTHYFVHQINFMSARPVMPRTLSLAKESESAALPNVSQKLTLQANVVLSSEIKANSNGR